MAWSNESRHDRGYGYQWVKVREIALRRDGHLCIPCVIAGRTTPATQVDHIVPKAQDGTDDLENLQGICNECHDAKTAKENGRSGKRGLQYDSKGFPIW